MTRTRRDFHKTALGGATLLALGPTAPAFLGRTARAAGARRADRDTILVVVQLAGGNDGLNTVVPHGDDHYAKNRPTLRLPTARLHRIDSLLGFHPRMSAFARLYHDGLLSVVQGVGYPNPNGGHFQSMHIWQTADPTSLSGRPAGSGGRLTSACATTRPACPARSSVRSTRPSP